MTARRSRGLCGTASRRERAAVERQPVAGNPRLRLAQRDCAPTDLIVQGVFHLVFLMEARTWFSRFRPKIRYFVGAAQFRRNEMIDFVLWQCHIPFSERSNTAFMLSGERRGPIAMRKSDIGKVYG